MYLQEIELRVQNTLTILGSIVNMIGGYLYDQLMSGRVFTLIMNKIHKSSGDYEANGYRNELDLLISSQ